MSARFWTRVLAELPTTLELWALVCTVGGWILAAAGLWLGRSVLGWVLFECFCGIALVLLVTAELVRSRQ